MKSNDTLRIATVANRLAYAIAGMWLRDHRAKPQLAARRVGARIDISFVVDDDVNISGVADRLGELVGELHQLGHA